MNEPLIEKERTLRDRVVLFLKGMGMGAADVVPGVSGGTIAFITGIYEELLATIRSAGPDTLKALRSGGIKGVWQQLNGGFLLPLLLGIGSSVLLLVRPIGWALVNEPVLIWSFFFGLIAASIYLVAKQVKLWDAAAFIALAVGTVIALLIGMSQAGHGNEALWFFFLSGMLAICAMILPGISGSFILLLLGAYLPVMQAIKDFDLKLIAVFAVGCVTGLMAFSRVLNWMFRKYHDLTVALMGGFLLGSLYVVWPWKQVISVRTVHPGKPDEHLVPFLQENVMPQDFSTIGEMEQLLGITSKDPQLLLAIAAGLFGAALLLVLDRFGPRTT